ncbi:hypothetical protein Cgig2_027740 [Carnegiea gigantea]|uniref:Uncharacterized protein n=1 Tax=Carnegiea gigantea TaxID=171969 RepID=A0A9Q1JWP0_9CARY|nr:hypothetical protein Cgig2_027740 [Carnegiea gigantea]
MKKLLEFGRKAMFYVRVLSGYEERRIRSYRLHIEKRLRLIFLRGLSSTVVTSERLKGNKIKAMAQERKEAVKRIPEQLILSEVRKMVEEMQNLNKRLQDMEADINEYFKPIDKEVESIINMQMEKEKAKTEMLGAMYKQAMLEKAGKEAATEATSAESADKAKMEMMRAMFKQTLLEKAEADAAAAAEITNSQNQTKASSSSHQAQIR